MQSSRSIEIVTLDATWNGLIDPMLIAAIDETPFLCRCRDGTVTLDELRTFVVQQHYYSRHFTRYLCALLANVRSEGDRLNLAANLFEELGLDGFGQVPHSQIYRTMMRELGLSTGTEPIRPSTQQLVVCMDDSCRNRDPLVGLGALCLGAEAIVPHIYSQIVRGFLANGVPEATLEFFTIHIAGDDAHAVTMKEIIETEVAADPEKAHVLREAARKALLARKAFFEGLVAPKSGTAEKVVNDVLQL